MRREDHSAPTSSLPLFADAARARRSDPETSHEAAGYATERLRASQEAVLRVFCLHRVLTDEQLLAAYNLYSSQIPEFPQQSPSGLRTRRHELVLLGKIVYTGRRDTAAEGKVKPRIWRLAAEAKSA